jgi:Protein of unknown function (DUF2997)
MERITIDFFPNGTQQIAVDGVKGEACKQATAAYETTLGAKISEVPTSEMYEQQENPARLQH